MIRSRVWIVVLWLLAAALLPAGLASRSPSCQVPPLSELETLLKGWAPLEDADLVPESSLARKLIGMCDQHYAQALRDASGNTIELEVFYCANRKPGNRLIYYFDGVNCLHGHYTVDSNRSFTLSGERQANGMNLSRAGKRCTVMYWLQSREMMTNNYIHYGLWLHQQDLLGERTDGCFVKLAYQGPPSAAKDEALVRLGREVQRCLPLWFDLATVQAGTPPVR